MKRRVRRMVSGSFVIKLGRLQKIGGRRRRGRLNSIYLEGRRVNYGQAIDKRAKEI